MDPEFKVFYAEYPVKRSPGDAEKAWRQTAGKRPPLPVVLEAVKRLRAEIQAGRPIDKVKYPASWLRARGWEDQIPAVTQNGANSTASPSLLAQIAEDAAKYR